MKKTGLLIALFMSLFAKAQPPDRFYAKFGGDGVDIAYGVKETYNRQYVLTGSTTSYGSGAADVYLLLVDSMGQLVWQKTFGGAMADVGKSIIVNPLDSGFVIAGYTSSFGNGGYDLFIVRTDKNGNLKWKSAFGGFDWDFGEDLTLAPDGNIIACGHTYSFGYGKSDGYVVKVNMTTGALIWEKYYGGAEEDNFISVKTLSSGGCYLAGNTKSYGDMNNDFWFFRIGAMGDSLSSKKIGNPNKAELCYDFAEDDQNDLVFCGSYDTSAANTGKNQAYMIKTDINANFISQAMYSNAGDYDRLLATTNQLSGNGYFFSRTVFKPGFAFEVQPFFTDPGFTFVNSNTYATNKNEEAYDAVPTKDNGFIMAGYTNGFSTFSEDVFLLKIDGSFMNSTLVVGLNENKAERAEQSSIYFYDNKIHFENLKGDLVSYTIFDSKGSAVHKGESTANFIDLNPSLSEGIYLIKLGNKTYKFIKN